MYISHQELEAVFCLMIRSYKTYKYEGTYVYGEAISLEAYFEKGSSCFRYFFFLFLRLWWCWRWWCTWLLVSDPKPIKGLRELWSVGSFGRWSWGFLTWVWRTWADGFSWLVFFFLYFPRFFLGREYTLRRVCGNPGEVCNKSSAGIEHHFSEKVKKARNGILKFQRKKLEL